MTRGLTARAAVFLAHAQKKVNPLRLKKNGNENA